MFKDLSKDKRLMYCGCSSDSAGGDASCSSSSDDDGGVDDAGRASIARAAASAAATAASEKAAMQEQISREAQDRMQAQEQSRAASREAAMQEQARAQGLAAPVQQAQVDQEIAAREATKMGNMAPVVGMGQPVGINISQRAIGKASDLMAAGKDEEAEELSQTYADAYTGISGYANRAVDYVAENPLSTIAAVGTLGMSLAPSMAINAAARGLDAYGVRGESLDDAISAATFGALESGGRTLGGEVGASIGSNWGPAGAAVGYTLGSAGGQTLGNEIAGDIDNGSLSGNNDDVDGNSNGDLTDSGYGFGYNDGYGGDDNDDDGSPSQAQSTSTTSQYASDQDSAPHVPYTPTYSSLQNIEVVNPEQFVSWQDGVPSYKNDQGEWARFRGY